MSPQRPPAIDTSQLRAWQSGDHATIPLDNLSGSHERRNIAQGGRLDSGGRGSDAGHGSHGFRGASNGYGGQYPGFSDRYTRQYGAGGSQASAAPRNRFSRPPDLLGDRDGKVDGKTRGTGGIPAREPEYYGGDSTMGQHGDHGEGSQGSEAGGGTNREDSADMHEGSGNNDIADTRTRNLVQPQRRY